jgi:hypothetical protein
MITVVNDQSAEFHSFLFKKILSISSATPASLTHVQKVISNKSIKELFGSK